MRYSPVPLHQAANTIVVTSRKTELAVQAVCVVLSQDGLAAPRGEALP